MSKIISRVLENDNTNQVEKSCTFWFPLFSRKLFGSIFWKQLYLDKKICVKFILTIQNHVKNIVKLIRIWKKIRLFSKKYYSKCHLYLNNWSVAPSIPASTLRNPSPMTSMVNDKNQVCRAVESWQIENLKSKYQYFLSTFQLLSCCFEFWLQRVQTVWLTWMYQDQTWNETRFVFWGKIFSSKSR